MIYNPGDIVLIPFPFSDLSTLKKRPVLVLNNFDRFGDFLSLPLTSQYHSLAIELNSRYLKEGGLPKTSWLRYDKIFTLHEDSVIKKVAVLKPKFFAVVKKAVCQHLDCCTHEY